jgi:hypothetical protein
MIKNIKINDVDLFLKYSSGRDYQQFYIKNNKNKRTFTSKYNNDNKLYERDQIIPSIFDQNILLLSSLNVNKTNNNDYIFCDYNFADIINKIYLERTNHKYTENFILKKDSKNEILTIEDKDTNTFIKLNSLIMIKDFYFRRTPQFTFNDFTKAIEEYKKINVRNNTVLYNYLIESKDISEEELKNNFLLLLDRLRLKAILEFSIWRTKLEDYKKKTRDSKGNIINRNPINYFKLILNPFNLEELVEIGINYSDRYKNLLEDKFTVLTFNGDDYKKNKYMYSNEEFEYIQKIENILGLGKILEKDLVKIENDYKNKLKSIELKLEILPEKEKILNELNNFDYYNDLFKFKENWELYIKLSEDKSVDKSNQSFGLNKLVYENISTNRLIIDKINDQLSMLKEIDNFKDLLSLELRELYVKLLKKYQNLLVDYENIYRYYRNLDVNNKRLIKNINTQLESSVKEKISNVNILVELTEGQAKKLNLNFNENLFELLKINIDDIKNIILPNISGENIKLFINPFIFEVKNRDTGCNISSFGNLGSVMSNKDKCNIETLYNISNYKRTYLDGNLIITRVISKGRSRDKKGTKIRQSEDLEGGGRRDRIERDILFNLIPSDRRIDIKLENILGMVIKLNYSSYLTKKYSGDFNISTRVELFQELNKINKILEDSNIPKIQIIIEDDKDEEKVSELSVKKFDVIRDEYVYPELINVLKTLESHPRYLEIGFLLELYFKHSKKEFKNNWLDYLIKLNDTGDLTQKVLLFSELDKLTFNVKLKFSKKEFIYNNNFTEFIRNLNEYIDIKEFISNSNQKLINKINELLLLDKISKYKYYQQISTLISNLFINEDVNIDNLTKINQLLVKILEEDYTYELSFDELQKIKEINNKLNGVLRDYNFIKEVRDFSKINRDFNNLNISNDLDNSTQSYILTESDFDRDTRNSRRIKGKKGKKDTKSRKTALIKSLNDIDFITVFKIIKNNNTSQLLYDLLSDKIELVEEDVDKQDVDKQDVGTISFIPRERIRPVVFDETETVRYDNFMQLGGDRKYQDRSFYLLRNEFYDERLKEIFNSISDKLKNYKLIILPEISKLSQKRQFIKFYEQVVEYYKKIIRLHNSTQSVIIEKLREIKDLVSNQVKNLNPYENDFNIANFEKIKQLEYQKLSFPFEIVYIHYGLDLKNVNIDFLEQITKEFIEFVKSINKIQIYREKSIEFKILNNLDYDYTQSINLIQKDLANLPILQTIKLDFRKVETAFSEKKLLNKKTEFFDETNNKLREYRESKKRLLLLKYLRFEESGGLGSELEIIRDDLSRLETEISDVGAIEKINRDVYQEVFKLLIKNIEAKINEIILNNIEKNINTEIFEGIYQPLYDIYLRNLNNIIEELKIYNINKKQPNEIILDLIKRNLINLQKTIVSNEILDNLFKIYNITKDFDETLQIPAIKQDLKQKIIEDILPYNSSICKNTFEIKIGQDILSLLSDKYKLLTRGKLNKISESKYNELKIVNQYQDKKYFYLIVNDGINNVPKYKQKKDSKIDEKILELSENEKQEINKFILVYSLNTRDLIIPYVNLINKGKRRVMKKLNDYVLCNKVKSPIDKNINKLLKSNIIILLIENFLNTKWENNIPLYLELSKELKDKYKNRTITTSNIQTKLLEFLNLLVDEIYINIPNKLDDKYFIQYVLKNNVYKYNFEWLLYYYVDVMKLQLLRDNIISLNILDILADFTKMLKNRDFENNQILNLEKIIELINKKNNILNKFNYLDIINGIQGDIRIKNLKGQQNRKKNQFIEKLKRDFENREENKRIKILENEINTIINKNLENFDKNISDLDRLEILIITLNRDFDETPIFQIDKDVIIKQILSL